jgi:membrane protease YdiL (CAAX protease family)
MFAPGVSFLTLLPFLLLLAAVLGLWIHRVAWMSALAAAVLAGYFTGALQGAAAVWIAIVGLLALAYAHAKATRGAAAQLATGAAFFAFALVMGLELLPGMARTVVIDPVVLSAGALPYSLALGFPKVVGGIFILGLIHEAHISSWRELGDVLKKTAPVFAISIAAVLACALALGYVRFEARWTQVFFAWALANLFFTCLSEEAFFRGFLQHELARAGSNREASRVIAWLVAAGLFGLVHLGGGWKFAVAATIAGLGYGWAYHRTQRVEAAMAVHFGLNASHFLLFTYPALA